MIEINLSAYDWIKKVEEIAEEYKEITIGNAKIIKEYRPPLDYFYLKKIKLSRGYYAPASQLTFGQSGSSGGDGPDIGKDPWILVALSINNTSPAIQSAAL